MDIVVGTAGHIDHGKTALVKVLTGVDADRLPEEKRRGITIDLGFAECTLDDVRMGFVDVPGHERFVKNMLAGVSGIDLVLLVVAADEGVMPQTREHFDICRLLGVGSGLVVLTKPDLVDGETLELARLEVAELVEGSFLEDAPVIVVSAKTGEGVDGLKTALVSAARSVAKRDDVHVVRLPVDRSFTVKGFGTVVTGTLVSGEIAEADELEILPGRRRARVRGLQTHGKKVSSVHRGQRVATNLAGVDHAEIDRGMTLSEAGVIRPTQIVDARVEVLPAAGRGIRTRRRVRVHIGTMEVLARVSILNDTGEIAPGETNLVQLRFETPIVAVPGERFIIRAYSPQATIAGGYVIDNLAEKHRKRDFDQSRDILLRLEKAASEYATLLALYLEMAGRAGLGFSDLQARTGLRTALLRETIAAKISEGLIVDTGDHFISTAAFRKLTEKVIETVAEFHRREPLAKGMPVESLREIAFAFLTPSIARSVLKRLETGGEIATGNETIRLATHRTELTAQETTFTEELRTVYAKAGYEVPRLEDALNEAAAGLTLDNKQIRKLMQRLVDGAEIVKVTDEFYFAKTSVDSLVKKLREYAASTSDSMIDVARFKEIAGVSRKYAIPLLEYFDRTRVTSRAGDKRVVLR